MRLALAGAYRPRWSKPVQDEWLNALVRNRPDLPRQKLERIRLLMEQHIPDAEVTGFEQLIGVLSLPDPNDRHVLAAAIECSASIIVTFNLKHFPTAILSSFGIEACHPDGFVLRLYGHDPVVVATAMREHRASLTKPAVSVVDYLKSLELAGLTGTAAAILDFSETL